MDTTRKLISKQETRISWLQIIGFILILLSVLYFIGKFIYNLFQGPGTPAISITADEISILFMIIMLGFAFAFPDLLQDHNKGLSTMRIITFMMVNVICMLLLKTGWNSKSLEEIGINGYWMGIIAFVFGSKAAQTYFEHIGKPVDAGAKPDSYIHTNPAKISGNKTQVATPPPGAVKLP